jgi:hypothetical protein
MEDEMNSTQKVIGLLAVVLLTMGMVAAPVIAQDKQGDIPYLVLKFDEVPLLINGERSDIKTSLNTELLYRFVDGRYGKEAELMSFGFVTHGFYSKLGETGNISVRFIPESIKSYYSTRSNQITTYFEAEVHYPLIDQIMGFKQSEESKEGQDNFLSYTESFSGVIRCRLGARPHMQYKEEQSIGIAMDMEMKIAKKAVGAIEYVALKKYEIEASIVWPLYFKKAINVQPVFVEYTPDTGCSLGGSVVSTGGSWDIMKEYAYDIWNRCCLHLNLLPPVYVTNDDWRILSSGEAWALRTSYDHPNAVEVFFTETFDPIGTWGGGATWGSGTANTKIITCDSNLPINLYNLAHELGHSLNLMHPSSWPWNSSPGSLMEPSGFCMDNPSLMSKFNCDNISNPLIYYMLTKYPCVQNPNM